MEIRKLEQFEYERKIGEPEVLGDDSGLAQGEVPASALEESERARYRKKEEETSASTDPYGEERVSVTQVFVGTLLAESLDFGMVRKVFAKKIWTSKGRVVLAITLLGVAGLLGLKLLKKRNRRQKNLSDPTETHFYQDYELTPI